MSYAVAQPSRRSVPPPSAAAASPHAAGYFLFLLVNAALFVRPAEIVPGAGGIAYL